MIISTQQYEVDEIRQILSVRCREEEVDMDPEATELLTRIASETSLRYAMHLIITSQLVATKRKSKSVEIQDIQRCFSLFVDVKRSTKLVMEYHKEFLYNELDVDGNTEKPTEPPTESMQVD
jgi:RuvB-like protein 2